MGYSMPKISICTPVYKMKGDTINVTAKAIYTMEIKKSNLFSDVKVDSIQKVIKIICD